MKVLAFDTSSKALSLAILEDKQVLAETMINIKKNHSITLMPAIDRFANCGSNCQDLVSYPEH